MDLNLSGKRAVVCGSTQGIGKAAAIELALLGAHVTLIARNEARLRAVVGELPAAHGQQHDYIVADFNAPEDLRRAIEAYDPGNDVHILVNNTGGPPSAPILDATLHDFMTAFANHLLCNQVLAQEFTPGMKRAGYGRIINIVSTSVKMPIKGLGVSNTIRGAVANWSKTLSVELAPYGITVNNVLPGYTHTARLDGLIANKMQKTGMSLDHIKAELLAEVPAGRIASPAEVAAAVAFLASPAAGYINGINVPVDGGRTGSL